MASRFCLSFCRYAVHEYVLHIIWCWNDVICSKYREERIETDWIPLQKNVPTVGLWSLSRTPDLDGRYFGPLCNLWVFGFSYSKLELKTFGDFRLPSFYDSNFYGPIDLFNTVSQRIR